jgi:hypothetical protein
VAPILLKIYLLKSLTLPSVFGWAAPAEAAARLNGRSRLSRTCQIIKFCPLSFIKMEIFEEVVVGNGEQRIKVMSALAFLFLVKTCVRIHNT